MRKNLVLGIDIGGSGVKGAIVNLKKGEFESERIRIPTPSPHTLQNMLSAIEEIVTSFKWKGIIGCGFPGVIRAQIIDTAANVAEKFYRSQLASK
ncbi:MAG: ROK family protein [Bacilli bacterium]